MLLRDRLADWVVELSARFEGTKDFVRAMSVFSREATGLGFAADFVNLEWFPSGSYLVEQGEAATTMQFLRTLRRHPDVFLLVRLTLTQAVTRGLTPSPPRSTPCKSC